MNYYEKKALSASGLKQIKKSPAHYKHWLQNPQNPTPAMIFGTTAHCYVLESEKFEKEYIVGPNIDRRTKEWKEFNSANNGKTIISASEYESLVLMKNQLEKNPRIKKLLAAPGEVELEKYWTDNGIDFKVKVDKWIPEYNIVLDYKTTTDASKTLFEKKAFSLDYHLQCAQYQEAFQKDDLKPSFLFIVQEKEAPYMFNVFMPTNRFMAYGAEQRENLIEIYKESLESDMDGGANYPDEILSLDLPGWI